MDVSCPECILRLEVIVNFCLLDYCATQPFSLLQFIILVAAVGEQKYRINAYKQYVTYSGTVKP